MFDGLEVKKAIANLEAYLDTWTDEKGGLHGYIIHHHRDYAVLISPNTWAQSIRILSHIGLWEKTGDPLWLAKVEKGADFLVSSYIWEEHLFSDSTTPLTLINNAWPCLALFRAAKTLRSEGNEKWGGYVRVAGDCLKKRIIAHHWDESVGDFFFCPEGFPSKRVHTFNQTAITISAFCALAELTGRRELVDRYAIPAADNLVANQITGNSELAGGWGYNDGGSKHLFYYLYTALNCRGLIDVYEFTREVKYLTSANLAGKHLSGLIEGDTKLFSHRYVRHGNRGIIYHHPIMISTSALGFLQIRRLNGHGGKMDVDENIRALLDYQKPDGGFPSFIGITDIWTPEMYPCEPEKRKWRDLLCVPFWAVFTLELLVNLLPDGTSIPPPTNVDSLITETDDGYEIQENASRVRLIKNGRTVSYFGKKDASMLFSTENMRGVPFGSYPNGPLAALTRARRRLKIGGIVGTGIILLEALLILYLI